ncbi:Transcription factor iws1 [Coelomomyces lativittatus]|nr:Transcription factor iws1 [Coelomomyces lativittatus]
MRDAAERDLVSFTKQKPAVYKLRLLPLVSKHLDRSELQEIFLDHHILDGFQSWLEPLPDGSLPSYDIRSTLFQLLLKLPITTDHLRECSIGPLIVFYTKAPKETPEIKRMAQECVTKWSRPILNISDSYRDTRLEERKVDLNDVKSKLVLRRGSNKPGYLDPKFVHFIFLLPAFSSM